MLTHFPGTSRSSRRIYTQLEINRREQCVAKETLRMKDHVI